MHEENSIAQALAEPQQNRKGLIILFALVLGIVLFAGLQPYGNYEENWISYTPETQETHFGDYGLVIGELPEFVEEAARSNQLQVQITPIISKPTDTKFHIFAQIDSPSSDVPLIFGQWNTSLIAINGHDRRRKLGLPRVSANLSRHVGVPAEVSFTFDVNETKVEIDGRFEASGPPFDFSDPLTRISIGNSPDGKFGWYGRLAKVKFLNADDPNQSVTYRFDKNALPTVQAESLVSTDKPLELIAPSPGGFPDKAWIGNLQLKQLLDNNITDVIVNFLGFAPFGFLLTALILRRTNQSKKLLPVIYTCLAGFLLSFGIESAQTMIPGRSPHMHDLFLNTSGTLLGSICFLLLAGLGAYIKNRSSDSEESTNDKTIEAAGSEHIDL